MSSLKQTFRQKKNRLMLYNLQNVELTPTHGSSLDTQVSYQLRACLRTNFSMTLYSCITVCLMRHVSRQCVQKRVSSLLPVEPLCKSKAQVPYDDAVCHSLVDMSCEGNNKTMSCGFAQHACCHMLLSVRNTMPIQSTAIEARSCLMLPSIESVYKRTRDTRQSLSWVACYFVYAEYWQLCTYSDACY